MRIILAVALTAATLRLTTAAAPGTPAEELAASAAFAGSDYSKALGLSFLFYAAQRSGKLPADNPIPWRGDSHLADCVPGGYHDAGDHLKLNFPLHTTIALLAWGVDEFRDAYAAAGQLDAALSAIRWGTDYILASHVAPSEYIGQVGDPGIDHAFWGRPEDQTGDRPCFKWDSSTPASDLAGSAASALAAASLAVRPTDAAYADTLVSHARQLLAMAQANQGKYSTSYNSATYVYSSFTYRDDLALGETLLWKATGETAYLDQAKADRNNSDFLVEAYVNWDAVGPVSAVMMQCAGVAPPEAQAHLDLFVSTWQQCNAKGFQKTSGGLCIPPLGGWGNLRHATSAALTMLVLAKCEPDAAKKLAMVQWAQSQVDYALGSTGRSFLIGFGDNYPKKEHHRAASCPDRPAVCDYNSGFNNPGDDPQLLNGGLVGGPPGPSDAYEDARNNYQTNEVALDYNAGFTGALAGLLSLAGGQGGGGRSVQASEPPPTQTGVLQSAQGLCMVLVGTADGAVTSGTECSPGDAGQAWAYDPASKSLEYGRGLCLAIDDESEGAVAHGSECDAGDVRQQWTYDDATKSIKSDGGSCLALCHEAGHPAYGRACAEDDSCQQWMLQ